VGAYITASTPLYGVTDDHGGGAGMDVVHFYSVGGEYGCFSNFSPHPVVLKGKTWPRSEHDFQAQKFAGSPDGRGHGQVVGR